jgi:hypothetical protein
LGENEFTAASWPKSAIDPKDLQTILSGISRNGENGIADAMRQAGAAAPFLLDIDMAWSHAESNP